MNTGIQQERREEICTPLFWTWPEWKQFGKRVFETLEKAFQQNLIKHPKAAILGLIPTDNNILNG